MVIRGEVLPGAPIDREKDPAGEPEKAENPDDPAHDPREPHNLSSFTSVALFFEVP